MDDDLTKRFRAMLDAEPEPALERLRKFLLYYIHSSDRNLLKLEATQWPGHFVDPIEAIDEVLAQPQEPGKLASIVAYEGNRQLADDTDATAIDWLRSLVADLRLWLGPYAPAPREGDQ